MYTEYVFENKRYEVALRDIKATLFDIVSTEEANISALREKAFSGKQEFVQEDLQELFVRQDGYLHDTLKLCDRLSEMLKKVDSCSRDLKKIEKRNTARIIANSAGELSQEKVHEADEHFVKEDQVVANQSGGVASFVDFQELAPVGEESTVSNETVDSHAEEVSSTSNDEGQANSNQPEMSDEGQADSNQTEISDEGKANSNQPEMSDEGQADSNQTEVSDEGKVDSNQTGTNDEEKTDSNLSNGMTDNPSEEVEMVSEGNSGDEVISAGASEKATNQDEATLIGISNDGTISTDSVQNEGSGSETVSIGADDSAIVDEPILTPIVEDSAKNDIFESTGNPVIIPGAGVIDEAVAPAVESASNAPAVIIPTVNSTPAESSTPVIDTEGAVETLHFKKRMVDEAPRVIMISAKQATNLRRSMSVQEALLSAKGLFKVDSGQGLGQTLIENGLLPSDINEKQAQIEQMMTTANQLYSEGKVEEAQNMYEKISALNKEIQGESVGITK